jgi:hypothetical protein
MTPVKSLSSRNEPLPGVISLDRIRNKPYTLLLAESLGACADRAVRRSCGCLKTDLMTTRCANRGNREKILFESAVTH